MQCFSGCFAPSDGVEPHLGQHRSDCLFVKHASSASSPAASQPEVHVFPPLIPGTEGDKQALKASLGLCDVSKSTQYAAAVAACSNSSRASPVNREQLHQEYLLQHGTNIMALSTLQQDRLKYFLIPGRFHAAAVHWCS